MILRCKLYRVLFIACTVISGSVWGETITPLQSGEPIPVGEPGGLGPLAVPGISATPYGAVSVYGAKEPDVFVGTGKFGTETGLFLYRWLGRHEQGHPIFGDRHGVTLPFDNQVPPSGTIFQTGDGTIHGLWLTGNKLIHTRYEVDAYQFIETAQTELKDLPRNPESIGIIPNDNSSVEVLLGVSDGVASRPTDFGWRDPQYRPYDGAGIYRGGLPYVSLYHATIPQLHINSKVNATLVSSTTREVLYTYRGITAVQLGPNHQRDIITGSHFGNFYYYHNNSTNGIQLDAKRFLLDKNNIAIRHPTINPAPIAYPNPDTGYTDIIASGEGALYYYRFTGNLSAPDGCPIFENPQYVLEERADLYGSSLTVPTVVDWNDDGALDLVAGNSEGRILFFQNAGTNERPCFNNGIPLTAGGREIHVQPGYRMDIQGPQEARWGYTCPTVADWNEDGLFDILMSDSTARHTVYMNHGKRGEPSLDAEHPLYMDGLDLHGTWRVRPAVAKLDSRMAYAALDDDDELHLYWRLDDYNLEDGGKLLLEDGNPIQANFISAGGTGRLKLCWADWDRDGIMDMLIGTPRHGSVPNPKTGLPQSLGLPGAAVLFLKNTATNNHPVFRFPVLLKFKDKPIFLGQHSCAPAIAEFGQGVGPNLIVGVETGRFIYYAREDISPR